MSLSILFIFRNKDIDNLVLEKEVGEQYTSVFGFEIFRHTLWGHPVMASLKCELISSLKDTDIYVFDEDILKLKTELQVIINNLDLIEQQTGIEKEAVKIRARNALGYIEITGKYLQHTGITIA